MELWRECQQDNLELNTQPQPEESVAPIIQNAFSALSEGTVFEVKMEEGRFKDVKNVAAILEAKFGYDSLNVGVSSVSDVTEHVQRYLKGTTLSLKGVQLLQEVRSGGGFLGMLGGAYDSARKGVYGRTRYLSLKLRSTKTSYESDDDVLAQRVNALRSALSESGVSRLLHEDDGHLTWCSFPF